MPLSAVVIATLLAASQVLLVEAKGGRYQTPEGYFLRVVGTMAARPLANRYTFQGQRWLGPDGQRLPGNAEVPADVDSLERLPVALWTRSTILDGGKETRVARHLYLLPAGSPPPEGPLEFFSAMEPPRLESRLSVTQPKGTKKLDAWAFLALEERPWNVAGSAKLDFTAKDLKPYDRSGLFPPETFQILLVEWPYIGIEYFASDGRLVRLAFAGRSRSFDPLPNKTQRSIGSLPVLDPGKVAARWVAKLKDGTELPLDAYMEAEIRDAEGNLLRRGIPLSFDSMKGGPGPSIMALGGKSDITKPEDLAEIRFVTQSWQRIVFRNLPLAGNPRTSLPKP